LIPAVFVIVGVALVYAAIRTMRGDRAFAAVAQPATAIVTALRWRANHDTSSLAYPVVRFSLPDGRTFEVESQWGARPAPAREGETVQVLYDPADPTRARLAKSMGASGFLWAIFLVAGLGCTALGVVLGVIFLLVRDAL
jgi:hypothetical protein